jgi:hypothetical protein
MDMKKYFPFIIFSVIGLVVLILGAIFGVLFIKTADPQEIGMGIFLLPVSVICASLFGLYGWHVSNDK